MTDIVFTEAALGDLRRLGPDAVPKVIKKILLLLESPEAGYPLGGELVGFRKLVVGPNTWRVVYRIRDDKVIEICEIWAIGERADAEVYAEATARIREAARQRPEFRGLAEIAERLGKLVGRVAVPQPKPREPVPDWLAERLIYTVGLPAQQVAAMSLEEAVDCWGEYTRTGK